MIRIIIILLVVTMFWGCKENSKQNTEPRPEQSTLKTDSVSKSPVRVFSIIHDSIYVNDQGQLTELNNSLNESFKEDKAIQDKAYLESRLNDYKLKRFPKHLAKEFENNSFTKATQTNVSFITPESEHPSRSIRLAEWYFKEESTAKSCFESLTNYRERTIHFKFISWIWVRQKNKLFLVFTLNFNVDAEPMQTIKRRLIDVIKKQGEYEVIEMD